MSDFILHHYPASPVAEKVRKVFGLKNLSWFSVEEERLPPRKELFAMTGGYRRIPVLQIGADIYCDTQCILKEIERRVPKPTLFPEKRAGLSFSLSRWTDEELFRLAFKVVIAPAADTLPADFVKDRARLYLGAAADLERAAAEIPHILSQLRAKFHWIDESLSDEQAFLSGEQAGLNDILVWFIFWFLKERYDGASELFVEFLNLRKWAERIEALGYGNETAMKREDALEIAYKNKPQSSSFITQGEKQDFEIGDCVSISTTADSGETPITGALNHLDINSVSLRLEHADCGETVVHFPRIGYRLAKA